MEFRYNRNKAELLRVMKSKGEKKNIRIKEEKGEIQVSLEPGKFSDGEESIPVVFKGTIAGNQEACSIKGKFRYGFYLYTLVIVAAILIIARFAWSAYQKQVDNMILCGIVAVLLIIVLGIVMVKSKPAKQIIKDFLNNLNVR